MEHVLNVLSHHSQIIAQASINSCQIHMKDPHDHKEKLQLPCCSNFQKDHMARDKITSAATAIALFGNDAFIQLAKLAKRGK